MCMWAADTNHMQGLSPSSHPLTQELASSHLSSSVAACDLNIVSTPRQPITGADRWNTTALLVPTIQRRDEHVYLDLFG